MPRRVVPRKTVEQVKRLLATKKFRRDIAKEAGVSPHYIWQLNMRYRIRPIVRKRIKISERKRRFIEKALGLAKYTSMIKIAKRAGVSTPTVQHINLLQRIRDKKALRRGRVRIPGKKFEGIVEELIKHPKKSFKEIAKQYGVSQPTVGDINKRLVIQPKEHIRERKLIKVTSSPP